MLNALMRYFILFFITPALMVLAYLAKREGHYTDKGYWGTLWEGFKEVNDSLKVKKH